MKKSVLFVLSFTLVLAFTSCEKNKVETSDSFSTAVDQNGVFTSDAEVLKDRIEVVNKPIIFTGKSTNELSYTWLFNATPPVMNGYTLSASCVDGYGDYVYFGWHARGPEVMGEVSIVKLNEDPNEIAMIQSGSFENHEFNDLEVKPNINKLFLAGGSTADMSGNSIGDNTALSMAYNLDPGTGISTGMDWENNLLGYSANSITYVANQTLWVSKGSQGGLTVFRDYDLSDVKLDMAMSNAKHFDATGDWGVLLYGVGFNESIIKVWDMTNLYDPVTEYTLPYDVTPLGKNSVDVNHDYAYLAMGNDGVVKVDLTDGSVVDRFDYENGGFCNGIAVDWRYIYAAYGADGLFVIDKETFEIIGNWDFDGSCNYVKKVGDYLYLANGDEDGLIILKKD